MNDKLPEFVYLDKGWPCVRNTWKDDIEKMLGHVRLFCQSEIFGINSLHIFMKLKAQNVYAWMMV